MLVEPPVREKKACSGYCCYKFWAVLYAIFYFIVGLLLLAIGSWVISLKDDYSSINDVLSSPSILAVIVGLFMILTALIGLIGAAQERLLLLRIFLGVIIIVFILQVIIGIIAFVYREETIGVIGKQMEFAVEQYTESDEMKRAVNTVQQKFECCGRRGPSDWDLNDKYNCANQTLELSCSVPSSCCSNMREGCGDKIRASNTKTELGKKGIYTIGCQKELLHSIEEYLDIVGATALGFALLHVLGIFVVYLLSTAVEDRQWLFKYRKRFYDNRA